MTCKQAVFATLMLVSAYTCAEIRHVEPPSWWVGMKNPQVQLMVHGENIAQSFPSVSYPGVSIAATHRQDNDNYLYIDLVISNQAQSGTLNLVFEQADGSRSTLAYPLNPREPGSAERQGFNPSDVMYLIMPDRFANGDPGNDTVKSMGDGLARSEPFGRHGGDLQGIINHLDYIHDMGFTEIWLNPVLENDMSDASYHGYAATDFYQVDARLGSNKLYRKLSDQARKLGIGLIHDVVLNHIGSEHWWMDDMPATDWLNFASKPVTYTNHRRETLHDPHRAAGDLRNYADGWFVETMPDLNQRNDFLATYLIQNSIWWVEYAGLSGIRVDTYPYPDKEFLTDWSVAVMAEFPNLNIVGEEWTSNQAILAYWQRGSKTYDDYESGLPSVFDFALQENLIKALTETDGWGTGTIRLYQTLANDFLYGDPDNLVVFPDNHDMSRIFTQLGHDVDLFRMAIAHTLTVRGIPQVFYGTEILMANPGTESHGVIRSDFPGGWKGDDVNAFTGKGLTPEQKSAQDYVRKLLNWRKNAPVIHHGKLMHFIPKDGVYVYFRYTDTDKTDTVMVIMNSGADTAQLETVRFAERIGSRTTGKDVISGERHSLATSLSVPAKTALILELE